VKRLNISLLWLYCFFLAPNGFAEPVELVTEQGHRVVANLLTGTNDANPVIILHGFLQTREFPTVNRLAISLNDSGYTVLNPSLSLGINNRKQSLSCEAIHTHSLDMDASELALWIAWLNKKTSRPVTLIAHSAGGPVVLKYLEEHNAKQVNHAVLISLSYYAESQTTNENKSHAQKALVAIRKKTNPLDTYSLNYCKKYPTFAKSFLSYYNWNKEKTSLVVNKFNKIISIVIGTDDKRIDGDWKKQLQSRHNNVVKIDGANHFFDQAHEFDLTDAVESILKDKTAR